MKFDHFWRFMERFHLLFDVMKDVRTLIVFITLVFEFIKHSWQFSKHSYLLFGACTLALFIVLAFKYLRPFWSYDVII